MKDKALKFVGERTKLIERLNARLEQLVGTSQRQLLELIIEEFVDKLDSKDGKITANLKNKRMVALLDNVFNTYSINFAPEVLTSLVGGVGRLLEFNKRYFSALDGKAALNPVQNEVKETISAWLGIDGDKPARNGYLDVLVKADLVKQEIKNAVMGKIVGQAGLTDLRKGLKEMLTDSTDGSLGRLSRYYRNFTYDLYSQVDRTAAKVTADKIGLNKYAIYEGGIIKTSRKFCRERNGKVFTYEEIEAFDPPVAKQPNYNPFVDLGGYACRHHLNWIPYAVAVALRPDLKKE